ncbi:hypothetical protein [Streptomyces sp. NPDC005533]|uniref:hypothetical protein n=1 Tax=Streptomyces sp. NPDC005533 TaxID=3364723 RepID=UPI0036A3E2F2
MTPNLGQGGCQAIEDAAVLAHLLPTGHTGHTDTTASPASPDHADHADHADRTDPIPAALAAYTSARRDRTNAVRLRARRVGRLGALRNPLAVGVRDLAIRATPTRIALRGMDDLFNGFRLP